MVCQSTRTANLLGVDGSLKKFENLNLNLGSELLLLGGTRVSNTLGLSEVVADGLIRYKKKSNWYPMSNLERGRRHGKHHSRNANIPRG